MTLSGLYKQIKYIGNQFNTWQIPMDKEVKLSLNEDDIVEVEVEGIVQYKDKQFKEQLTSLKDEIQSNLCASSGFNDEYSRGYQDCGMKVMEMIDKILEL